MEVNDFSLIFSSSRDLLTPQYIEINSAEQCKNMASDPVSSNVQPIMNREDSGIQDICDKVKNWAERKSGRSFAQFKAKSSNAKGEMMVTGTDFYIKVDIGNGSYVHIWVYECPPMAAQAPYILKGIQVDKTETDALLPWEAEDKGPWTNLSKKKEADSEVQSICDEVKADAEIEAKKIFTQFEAKFYFTQGDYQSGTDFFVKVHVGGGSFVHVWIYRCRPMVAQKFYTLKGILENKTELDPLLPLPWKPQRLFDI